MKIIRPFNVVGAALVASSVPEVDTSMGEVAYSSTATYPADAVVVFGARKYESIQANNTNHNPTEANSTWWLDIGPTNRWAAFDQINGTQTQAANQINFRVQTSGRVDSVALLNFNATSAQVVARRSAGGTVVYNRTFDLNGYDGINDWYGYFFAETSPKTDLVVDDLPLYSNMEIEVTLSRSGTVMLGTAVIGLSKELGDTVYGARVGINDFSRKTTDDFGNYNIVPRAFSKRGTFPVVVKGDSMEQVAGRVDALQKLLAGFRAIPLVWVGAEQYGATVIYGFYKSFELDIAYPMQSALSLEVEGVT